MTTGRLRAFVLVVTQADWRADRQDGALSRERNRVRTEKDAVRSSRCD